MITKTINLYTFDELTPDAQNKAIENLRDVKYHYDWWESTYDDFHSIAKYFGFDVDLKNTWFTLSYSQGDGSSFTADVDVLKLISCIESEGWKEYAPKENFSLPSISKNVLRICKLIERNKIDIGKVHIYPCNRETNVSIVFEHDYANTRVLERIEYAIGELNEIVLDTAKELNKFLYRQLRDECDYQSSREAIIETIKANEYTFTENGKLENA
jgi:hypothetical protein